MAKKRTVLAGPARNIPSGKDGPILTPRVTSQIECRIRFVLPARRFSHVLNKNTDENLFSRGPVVAE